MPQATARDMEDWLPRADREVSAYRRKPRPRAGQDPRNPKKSVGMADRETLRVWRVWAFPLQTTTAHNKYCSTLIPKTPRTPSWEAPSVGNEHRTISRYLQQAGHLTRKILTDPSPRNFPRQVTRHPARQPIFRPPEQTTQARAIGRQGRTVTVFWLWAGKPQSPVGCHASSLQARQAIMYARRGEARHFSPKGRSTARPVWRLPRARRQPRAQIIAVVNVPHSFID